MIGDVVSAVLPGLRREAESRFLDRCDIVIQSGLSAPDATTGTRTPTYTTLLANVPCRVKVSDGLSVAHEEAGGHTAAVVTRALHVAWDTAVIPAGAIAVMTSVHATSDPTLAGAWLRVLGPAPGSQTTARRLQVEEVVS